MKKILTIFLVLLTTLNIFGFYASAADENVKVSVSYQPTNRAIIVSGTVVSAKDRIPMTLSVFKGDDMIAAAETLAVGKTAEGVPFSFPSVSFDVDMKSADLTLKVAATWVGSEKAVPYSYKGVDSQLAALKVINDAVKTGTVSAMQTTMTQTAGDLNVDTTIYDKFSGSEELSQKAKEIAAKSLLKHSYTLPENCDTKENCKLIYSAVSEYHTNYSEAVALASFFHKKTGAELKAWYDLYRETYHFLEDDDETTVDERIMLSYFDSVVETSGYLSRRSLIENATNMKELNRMMKEQAVLQNIETSNQYIVRNVLDDLSAVLGVDYDKWNKLSGTQQGNVCLAVVGNSYSSFEAFSEAVNDAITEENEKKKGGGGSSGSGGKGSSQVMIPDNVSNQPTTNVASFTDIAHVSWAKEAILSLWSNKIIYGRDESHFAPDASITRAELSKMLVLGLKLDLVAVSGRFADVSSDAWYAEYVETAAQNGFVFGDEQGYFRPNEQITREDAATILYRALGFSATESASFEDYESISDYAKTAVDCMYAKGIVNGVGDGIFAPRSSLTRAQAAKMLYYVFQQ